MATLTKRTLRTLIFLNKSHDTGVGLHCVKYLENQANGDLLKQKCDSKFGNKKYKKISKYLGFM